MRIAVFSTKPYDRTFLDQANQGHQHQLVYLDARLTVATAALASGFSGVCAFVNDKLDREVLQLLHANGTRLIALRSAGFNNVDLPEADEQ